MKSLLFFLAVCFVSISSWSYPQFIGYGYSSCLTCHFNSHGSGPLNDYGRALWSAEIASRSFYSDKKTDEQIAEGSGFLGDPNNTPWWIRPHIKYRNLVNRTSFGSASSQQKTYLMQVDLGGTLILNQDANHVISYTAGYFPLSPKDSEKGKMSRFLAREYYYRGGFFEKHWIYVGLMDIVFGIRNVDHTSYSRQPQRITLKNDQTIGAFYQYIETKWEATVHTFTGNPYVEDDLKMKGSSFKFEYEFVEKQRTGLSVLNQKNKTQKIDLVGLEYRFGFQKGASIMTEFGLINDQNLTTAALKKGSWFLIETWIPIARGYNFRTLVERYNDDFKPSADDQWKWDVGLMMFPAPRFEVRLDLLQKRTLKNTTGTEDNWALQGQLHVSL
jgi:hypothetical protein